MIKIESLNKYYNKGSQNEIHVINNVSLELPESGVIAIYGKSGCGKTTLLNAIGGLDTYASGKIIIDGITLDKDIDVIRNKYIGYIFQNYYLNRNETVYENVANAIKLCGIRDENIIANIESISSIIYNYIFILHHFTIISYNFDFKNFKQIRLDGR